MNLLMISGDNSIALGKKGTYYFMLEEFSKYWDRIDIICPGATKAEPAIIHNNVFIHPSTFPLFFHPFYIYKKGVELFREREYDIFTSHDFGWHYNGIGSWLLWRKTKVPYVSEIHHITGYPRCADFEEILRRLVCVLYIKWAKARVKAFRVVNKKELLPYLQKIGVPRKKIFVLYSLYIDYEVFQPIEAEKKYDVIYCGRLDGNKGIEIIIDAVGIVKKTFPNIKLLIKGSGRLESALKNYVERLELKDNIEFLRWVENAQDLALLYNQSKMLVCASYNEGGPRVTVEAMACGIPVISTPVGIMKELINNSKNGCLFKWGKEELAEKIDALLRNEDLRKAMGENGRVSVQGFDYRKTVRDYALGYQKITAKV